MANRGTEPHLGALIVEALEEALQQLVGVVNPLGVLANNPDHSSTSVRLIQRVEVLTQGGDDAFIPKHVRVTQEKPQEYKGLHL